MTSLAELLSKCESRDIRLALSDNGGLAVDAPEGVLTSDLLTRLKAHKVELLMILDRNLDAPSIGQDFCGWESKPDFFGRTGWEDPSLLEDDRWWTRYSFADLPMPGNGCPVCDSLELWWDILGGTHCPQCNPPTTARRLAERAREIRRRENRMNTTGRTGQ